jgi:hypothetical protein
MFFASLFNPSQPQHPRSPKVRLFQIIFLATLSFVWGAPSSMATEPLGEVAGPAEHNPQVGRWLQESKACFSTLEERIGKVLGEYEEAMKTEKVKLFATLHASNPQKKGFVYSVDEKMDILKRYNQAKLFSDREHSPSAETTLKDLQSCHPNLDFIRLSSDGVLEALHHSYPELKQATLEASWKHFLTLASDGDYINEELQKFAPGGQWAGFAKRGLPAFQTHVVEAWQALPETLEAEWAAAFSRRNQSFFCVLRSLFVTQCKVFPQTDALVTFLRARAEAKEKAKNGFHPRDFFICCHYPELFADHQIQQTVEAAALRINEACGARTQNKILSLSAYSEHNPQRKRTAKTPVGVLKVGLKVQLLELFAEANERLEGAVDHLFEKQILPAVDASRTLSPSLKEEIRALVSLW